MEIVDKLREMSEGFSWGFDYGRTDFHNLADVADNTQWHLFLDPASEDTSNDEFSTFEGFFMLLSAADLDQNYDGQKDSLPTDGKWKQNIEPKKTFLKEDFKNKLLCDGNWEIQRFKMTDVINIFDNNMDGVLVNFLFKYYQ